MLMPALTKRVDLNLGYHCNTKCRFCYYLNSVEARRKDKNLTTEEAKTKLKKMLREGIKEVEFTGGEPTIRKDLFELSKYAKNLGFNNLSIISNGIVLANSGYARKLVDAGIDDFLFSVHGHNASLHDDMTRTPGSFDRLMQAVSNVYELGARLRTNTVINGCNYKNVNSIIELLLSLKIQRINFILFNPIIQASCAERRMTLRYSDAAPLLKRAVEKYKDRLPHFTIRYIPFCLMQGYEQYITNLHQLQYDPDEWNYYVGIGTKYGPFVRAASTLIGLFFLPDYRRVLRNGAKTLKQEGIMRFLAMKNKKRSRVCRRCRYDKVCDALWRNYAHEIGTWELQPVPGEKIVNPAWAMLAAHLRPPGRLSWNESKFEED